MEHKLGSIENPVRCTGVYGEHEYLDRLAGPNGERIHYERQGSFANPSGKGMLDCYDLSSPDAQLSEKVYMDMYSENYQEKKAIEGLCFKESFKAKGHHEKLTFLKEKSKEIYGNQKIEIPSLNIYVWAKAGRLLTCGPFLFSKFELRSCPVSEWNESNIMDQAHAYVYELKGTTAEHPLIVETEKNLNVFMSLFSFLPVKTNNKSELAHVFLHSISNEEVTVYAKIRTV